MVQDETEMDKIKVEDIGDMLGRYMQQTGWTKLCLLLDYDGYGDQFISEVLIMMTVLRTLAPHGSHPDLTVLPENTRAVLQRLADMPEVPIHIPVIISADFCDCAGVCCRDHWALHPRHQK